jgi:hypothetical protein
VAERLEANYRNLDELHCVVVGAYVADCSVAAPAFPCGVRSTRSALSGPRLAVRRLTRRSPWHGWVLMSLRSGPSARTDWGGTSCRL